MAWFLGALKNMDINQIQQYIKSANQAIGTIQGLIEMFQGSTTHTRRGTDTEAGNGATEKSILCLEKIKGGVRFASKYISVY